MNAGTESGQALFAPLERDGFSFAIFGDRTTGEPAGLAVLAEGVHAANRLDVDFTMTVGDLVQGYCDAPQWIAEMRAYKAEMAQLRSPWFPVVGNHDVYGESGSGRDNVALYREHFGPLYYSFDHRWAHFVCLFSDEALSFSNPAVDQHLSQEQFDWLSRDLESSKATQVFVFLHHPRWTYTGTNWPAVHALLERDGRVQAVFAGHLHTLRDDGVRGGIHYHVLGATGAHTGPFKETVHMQEVAHVRVRPDGYGLSILPVGGVHGADLALGSEVDEMSRLKDGGWASVRGRVELARGANGSSTLQLAIANPLARAMDWRVGFSRAQAWTPWILGAERRSGVLAPGERLDLSLRVGTPPFDGREPRAALEAELDYRLASGLVQPLRATFDLPTTLRGASRIARAATSVDRALSLDGTSSLRVPLDERFDALTLECWVKAEPVREWTGLVAKTQSSGFSLTWGEQGPTGNLSLVGSDGYVRVSAAGAPDASRFSHVAFAWDGERARLFVDGRLAGDAAAEGTLADNRLPLFVGADTNARGEPEHPFAGLVDEVRLSRSARYERDFEPARRLEADSDTVLLLHFDTELEGAHPDASDREYMAWPIGAPELVAK